MSESNISLRADTTADTFPLPSEADADRAVTTSAPSSLSVNATKLLQWIFSFPALMGSLLVGVTFAVGRAFHVDPDLWWHIKIGDTILTTHRWPTTDTYSFTVLGQPWIAHEWLGDVLFAAVYRIAGITGLGVLLIVLCSSIAIGLYVFATIHARNSKAGFVAAAFLLPLATVSFTLRPQMLGYVFLILTLVMLELFRQGKRKAVWFLPFLMLIWVNTHGSWIMGPVVMFVYWTSGLVEFRIGGLEAKRWTSGESRDIGLALLLCLATVPLTPYGTRLAMVPFEVAFSLPVSVGSIGEFQSMPFHMVPGEVFLALLLATILIQVTFQFAWRLEELELFLFGTMMACLHVRFLLIFVPFFVPRLALILTQWIPRYDRTKDKFVLNATLMACVVTAMIHYFPLRSDLQQRVAKQFPVAAIQYIQQYSVPEPMLNNYQFGGYLLWSRGPTHKVFLDGRSDVYERGAVLSDYLHITNLEPGALAVLDGYGIQSCLLSRDEPLVTALSASPKWRKIYTDNVSALFVRTQSTGALTVPGNLPIVRVASMNTLAAN